MNMKIPQPTDKTHHFVYSYAICLTFCLLFSFMRTAPIIAVLITLAIGLAKEAYDYTHPTKGMFELKDLLANGLGILTAVAMFYGTRIL